MHKEDTSRRIVDRSGLVDILPRELVDKVVALPEDLIGMTSGSILRKILYNVSKNKQKYVQRNLETFRHTFWLEYDAASDQNRKMDLHNICRGAVDKSVVFRDLLATPERIAFVIVPPANYQAQILAMLDKASERISEILDLPLTTQKCRCRLACRCKDMGCVCKPDCKCPMEVDAKLVGIIAKIHETLELRAKGALLQRVSIDKRHLVAQIHAQSQGLLSSVEHKVKELTKSNDVMSVDDINAQIKVLEDSAVKGVTKAGSTANYGAKQIVHQTIVDEVRDKDDLPELEEQ